MKIVITIPSQLNALAILRATKDLKPHLQKQRGLHQLYRGAFGVDSGCFSDSTASLVVVVSASQDSRGGPSLVVTVRLNRRGGIAPPKRPQGFRCPAALVLRLAVVPRRLRSPSLLPWLALGMHGTVCNRLASFLVAKMGRVVLFSELAWMSRCPRESG
jgi:hypothetical protein